MTSLKIYQVDAFTDRVFAGNPAAVVPLDTWLPEATMQAIAAENNLSETAFFVPEGDGYAIRWFTPALEATLCGHATLGSAYVIARFLAPERTRLSFRSQKAGMLHVTRSGDRFALDFPVWKAAPATPPAALAAALGAAPHAFLKGPRDGIAVFRSDDEVAALSPDSGALKREVGFPIIATGPGKNGIDFVSRFFAPTSGIDEDPVTGSAHCSLIPYWAAQLGKTSLRARQISRRGGDLDCALNGDRVSIAGKVALYLEGTITL